MRTLNNRLVTLWSGVGIGLIGGAMNFMAHGGDFPRALGAGVTVALLGAAGVSLLAALWNSAAERQAKKRRLAERAHQ